MNSGFSIDLTGDSIILSEDFENLSNLAGLTPQSKNVKKVVEKNYVSIQKSPKVEEKNQKHVIDVCDDDDVLESSASSKKGFICF